MLRPGRLAEEMCKIIYSRQMGSFRSFAFWAGPGTAKLPARRAIGSAFPNPVAARIWLFQPARMMRISYLSQMGSFRSFAFWAAGPGV
jgi:hypothetical protein